MQEEITVNIDALRDYLIDYVGAAMDAGLPMAMADLIEIETMADEKLCEKALEFGVDLRDFAC